MKTHPPNRTAHLVEECVQPGFHTVVLSFLLLLFLFIVPAVIVTNARAEDCPPDSTNGGQSLEVSLTIQGTGQPVTTGAFLAPNTVLVLHGIAEAFGHCTPMLADCSVSPCSCTPLQTYERTINKITAWSEISTNNGLNGTYSEGNIFGLDQNGFTTSYHVLDSHSSLSTGPLYLYLPYPGTYTYHIIAYINGTPCNLEPYQTQEIVIRINVGETVDQGTGECQTKIGEQPPQPTVGEPVNVTNGNMYIQQTDYRLPGIGEGLEITRTYNSQSARDGIFGHGWTSNYEESVEPYGSRLLRLNLGDGRAIYFTRANTNSPYVPGEPLDFRGQVVKNIDNTYTLTFKDGRVHQFNTTGKLLSQADRNGNTFTLAYDTNGFLSTVTDASGRMLTFTFGYWDMVGSVSDSQGTIATYTNYRGAAETVRYADGSGYNFNHNYSIGKLMSVSDVLGNVLESHTYDAQGRAITSQIAGNGTELYTLNYVSATETDVTDALNHVTKYFFDTTKGRGVVTSIEGSCSCGGSQVQSWTYDNQLNVTSKTDALNHTTTFTYDTNGNRLTKADATGTINYTYNSLGEVLTVTDQMSGVWTNTYDSHGNLLTAKDPLNNTTTLTYDTHGQLLTVTDPRNNTTTFTYDTNGNLTRRTDALTNQTNIAYDTRGRVTSVTNAISQVTSYEYDLAGRLKKIIYSDTNFVLFTYDLAGRRTKIKDPRGYETNFAYDAAYRLTSETNADNKVTSYAYDLMSNLTGVTDALNRTTNYNYDDFNRLKKITHPEATAGAGRLEENFTYDLAGNLLEKKDQANRIISFCYDSVNRLTSSTDGALKVTSYEYNARSQLTAVVDAINQRYEFVYDSLGRVTQNKKATATMSFVYDAAGNRSQRTDYNGAATNYSYDALNRLTTISYPDTSSATYGYDVVSKLTTATNQNGTITIAYDNRSRVSSVTDVFGQVVSYSYDANSNRTQLNLNAAISATYQYDVLNRLTQLTDGGSLNTTFVYDATNKVTSRTLPNGILSTYQYDDVNRLTRLTHAKGANTLADFQYQFNAVNNITQMIDSTGTHNYSYDSLDRLTAATHPAGQSNESYTYDDVGNRTASHQGSSYIHQPFNRLTAANGASFSYDTNGSLTSKADANGTWNYTWDYENRLKQAALSSGVTINYSYDALGRRIQRASSASGTTKFVYDGPDAIRDLDSGGGTTADYLNGPGIDNKLREAVGGTPAYFLTDHLGTTRALTDSSGNVTTSLTYDSFGNPSGGSSSTRFTYTGREFDSDTSLMYYRARYNSLHGRFLSEDPIGFGGGVNFYAYIGNGAPNYKDPSGLERLQPYHLKAKPATSCECDMEILGQAAQFSAGFGDTLTASFAQLAVDLARMNNGIPLWLPPGWSPSGYIRGFTPGGAVVDPNSNAYVAGQVTGVAWEVAVALAGASAYAEPFPPNSASVVRGGIQELPPSGTPFSGAYGNTLQEAASGVPHGTIRCTTAGAIRSNGGSVVHAPEMTRSGLLNELHVNITEGSGPTTFSDFFPNPVPKSGRVK